MTDTTRPDTTCRLDRDREYTVSMIVLSPSGMCSMFWEIRIGHGQAELMSLMEASG